MTLQIGIFGRGRLGSAIAAAATQDPAISVAWAVGQRAPDTLSPVDVALEVSHPDAVSERIAWAQQTNTDLVIGTTGWDRSLLPDDRSDPTGSASRPNAPAPTGRTRPTGPTSGTGPTEPTDSPQTTRQVTGDTAGRIGILTAPNFSLSIALLRRLSLILGRYAAAHGADLAVSERHHTGKVDAPSGTALLLREALTQGSGQEQIQTTSLRLGSIVGRHDVHLSTPGESITLTHEAHNRQSYALGALTAARWLHGRPGLFTFDDLASDVIEPLFQPTTTQKEEP